MMPAGAVIVNGGRKFSGGAGGRIAQRHALNFPLPAFRGQHLNFACIFTDTQL